jgi:Family of unknown function (DUF5989)
LTDTPGQRFLAERRRRRLLHEIKRQIVLGLLIGYAVLAYCVAHLYFVPTQHEALMRVGAAAGLLLIALSVILPQGFGLVEAMLRRVGSVIGETALKASLILVYFGVMTPIGGGMRLVRGAAPIHSWQGGPPRPAEHWRDKSMSCVVRGNGTGKTSFFSVLSFFVEGGKILFLPALMVLLGVGLALYFVNTSVIAPFIYTLF